MFTSDIFKAYVGDDGARCGIEMWLTESGAIGVEITRLTPNLDEFDSFIIRLDADDVRTIASAFQQACDALEGGR